MAKQGTWVGVALAVTCAWSASAQDNVRGLERLEVTMTLLPEQARDAVEITRRIELPPATERRGPTEPAGPPTEPGQQGRDTAAEARELGRDFGQRVAEEARENRENAGRGAAGASVSDSVPGGPPSDLPGPPANPGRP